MRLGQGCCRIRQVMQHQQQRCGVELIVGNRKRFEFATSDLDGWQVAKTTAGRLEHFTGSIDGNHACDEWCQSTCDLTSPATEIADGPTLVEQRGKRLEMR